VKNVNSCCLEIVILLAEEKQRKQRKMNMEKNAQIRLMFVIGSVLGIEQKLDLRKKEKKKNAYFIFSFVNKVNKKVISNNSKRYVNQIKHHPTDEP
jgi:hypothetical protein